MELKGYQQEVIADLRRYLELLNEAQGDAKRAFAAFWQEKGVTELTFYQDFLRGIPNLCLKVPTGGGKTFLACNAIKPILDALPSTRTQAVVWLVPSEAILTQTLRALKDTYHPYRQRLEVDFGGRVEVYAKEELLNGQNFNPTAVTEQLSVMVLSYDSFRRKGKEGLKAYQENGNLALFAKVLRASENPIEGADETALFQVINRLNPVVIVDESHHARSELSREMLQNFNPCFVLDLTATPRQESNILAYVDAARLKAEHMVKLPVIVYNRHDKGSVVVDAIDLRDRLEEFAEESRRQTGRYIRPIVLFQAQPKGKEDAETFGKLRKKLVEAGILEEQIAIRTAEVNELKGVDLLSRDCPVRYIITVNALKEGWDCPFAYILATIANRSSPVEVEQIVGRILRLPHTAKHPHPALNLAYVLTCSDDFTAAVNNVLRGLNNAGFSEQECRLGAPAPAPQEIEPEPEPSTAYAVAEPEVQEEFLGLDGESLGAELERRRTEGREAVEEMLFSAEQMGEAYEQAQAKTVQEAGGLSQEVRSRVPGYRVKACFEQEIKTLRIPQFFHVVPGSLFFSSKEELLSKEVLSKGFSLKGRPTDIDFTAVESEVRKIDVSGDAGDRLTTSNLDDTSLRGFRDYFSNLPEESRVSACKELLFTRLNRDDSLDAKELRPYINRIVDDLDNDQLLALQKAPWDYAQKIEQRIADFQAEYRQKTFEKDLETRGIVCKPSYLLPTSIQTAKEVGAFERSLYEYEECGNALEQALAIKLTALENVRWWHRNLERKGFCINGFINHYPDFLIMTKQGTLVAAETKGGQLQNQESQAKVALGQAWAKAAGDCFRYYMVFADNEEPLSRTFVMREFLDILKNL